MTHQVVRLLAISYMSHNLMITDHARLLDPNETMEMHMMRTRFQSMEPFPTSVFKALV